jgi:hypothetical protein
MSTLIAVNYKEPDKAEEPGPVGVPRTHFDRVHLHPFHARRHSPAYHGWRESGKGDRLLAVEDLGCMGKLLMLS